MSISEIELYTALRQKLGDREAQDLVEFVKTEVKDSFDARNDQFATKEDLAKVEGKLGSKISETKADIIKWMFIFWVGQLASLIAIIEFVLRR